MLYEDGISVVSKLQRFMYSSTEVIPGVFQVTHRGANVLVIAEKKITIVDTGLRESAQLILDFIRNLGRSPEEVELIILTHNHIDHMGGLAEIKKQTGARVAVHVADIGERIHPPAADSRYREPLARIKSTLHSLFSIMPGDVDIRLDGGEILGCLDGLLVIHTPGHTPGSISLYSNKYQLMITGDLIRKHRKILLLPPRMVSYDIEQNLKSISNISRYDIKILCFGHGLPLSKDVNLRLSDLVKRGKN